MNLAQGKIGFWTALRLALTQGWRVFRGSWGYPVQEGDTLIITTEYLFGGIRRGYYEKGS